MPDLWKMLHTKRWHTRPQMHHVYDDTGGHSGRMIAMAFNAWDDVSLELVKAIIEHDAAESVVGDIPYEAKKNNKKYKAAYEKAEDLVMPRIELNELNHKRLKFLDLLDAARMVKLYSYFWWHSDATWQATQGHLNIQAIDLDVNEEFREVMWK